MKILLGIAVVVGCFVLVARWRERKLERLILQLLASGGTYSGGAIREALNQQLWWKLAIPPYTTLHRMEERGYIESSPLPRGRGSRQYKIEPRGHQRLAELLR